MADDERQSLSKVVNRIFNKTEKLARSIKVIKAAAAPIDEVLQNIKNCQGGDDSAVANIIIYPRYGRDSVKFIIPIEELKTLIEIIRET